MSLGLNISDLLERSQRHNMSTSLQKTGHIIIDDIDTFDVAKYQHDSIDGTPFGALVASLDQNGRVLVRMNKRFTQVPRRFLERDISDSILADENMIAEARVQIKVRTSKNATLKVLGYFIRNAHRERTGEFNEAQAKLDDALNVYYKFFDDESVHERFVPNYAEENMTYNSSERLRRAKNMLAPLLDDIERATIFNFGDDANHARLFKYVNRRHVALNHEPDCTCVMCRAMNHVKHVIGAIQFARMVNS